MTTTTTTSTTFRGKEDDDDVDDDDDDDDDGTMETERKRWILWAKFDARIEESLSERRKWSDERKRRLEIGETMDRPTDAKTIDARASRVPASCRAVMNTYSRYFLIFWLFYLI